MREDAMASSDLRTSRRSIMKGAGLGGFAAALGAWRTARGAPLPAAPAPELAAASGAKIWRGEYWAKKGNVSLYMSRKRLGAPERGETPRPMLFLVHGSSLSSLSFDLTPPGLGEYSVMNVFAKYGFDVWTMDHEGYGRSTVTSGNSDIKSGVEDLKAAMEVIQRETGRSQLHFFGESSGALRAASFASAEPQHVNRLALAALTYTGKGSPTLKKRAEQAEYYRTHNRRTRDRKMIMSIFTRDKPGTSDPRVGNYLADQELKYGDTVPTGTYLDMTVNLPVVDPAQIKSPVIIMRGQYDGIATPTDILEFFEKLPTGDKQIAILPGLAHSLILGVNREQFWYALHSFLTMPPHENV
jgi:alpha-beta hydrolase superfamily lysophospholipase